MDIDVASAGQSGFDFGDRLRDGSDSGRLPEMRAARRIECWDAFLSDNIGISRVYCLKLRAECEIYIVVKLAVCDDVIMHSARNSNWFARKEEIKLDGILSGGADREGEQCARSNAIKSCIYSTLSHEQTEMLTRNLKRVRMARVVEGSVAEPTADTCTWISWFAAALSSRWTGLGFPTIGFIIARLAIAVGSLCILLLSQTRTFWNIGTRYWQELW